MTKKKAASQKKPGKSPAKNSLVANINRRKKAGTSRSKTESTISPEAYKNMQLGWGKKKAKRKSAAKARKTTTNRKKSSKKTT